MKTLLIELRYNPQGEREAVSHIIDGLNDVLCVVAYRFGLDILSVSHVFETVSPTDSSFSCTAICSLNGRTLKSIAKTLKAENTPTQPNERLYCFEDANKLSVNVYQIDYN